MQTFVVVLLGLYLALVTFSALMGFGSKMITKRNLLMTVFAVLVTIAFTYIYLRQGQMSGLYGVAGGLLGISAIALNNGLNMRQRPNIKHHIIRMGVNVVFLLLLYVAK